MNFFIIDEVFFNTFLLSLIMMITYFIMYTSNHTEDEYNYKCCLLVASITNNFFLLFSAFEIIKTKVEQNQLINGTIDILNHTNRVNPHIIATLLHWCIIHIIFLVKEMIFTNDSILLIYYCVMFAAVMLNLNLLKDHLQNILISDLSSETLKEKTIV